jgi:hypothetical protein
VAGKLRARRIINIEAPVLEPTQISKNVRAQQPIVLAARVAVN